MKTNDQLTQLRQYLEARKAFDITKLENEAGCTKRSLYRWLKRVKVRSLEVTLSQENQDKIEKHLRNYYGFHLTK